MLPVYEIDNVSSANEGHAKHLLRLVVCNPEGARAMGGDALAMRASLSSCETFTTDVKDVLLALTSTSKLLGVSPRRVR